jgi:hypothetical protein
MTIDVEVLEVQSPASGPREELVTSMRGALALFSQNLQIPYNLPMRILKPIQ